MSYLEKCFEKDPNIVSRKIADEVILVPIRRGVGDLENIFTLNEVGAFVWELLNGENKLKDIVKIISEDFDIDPKTAEKDLIYFVHELEKVELIKN